jgi:hypothetical protein
MHAVAVKSQYYGSKPSKPSKQHKPLAKDVQIRPIQTAVNIETLAAIHRRNRLSAFCKTLRNIRTLGKGRKSRELSPNPAQLQPLSSKEARILEKVRVCLFDSVGIVSSR